MALLRPIMIFADIISKYLVIVIDIVHPKTEAVNKESFIQID